MSTAPFVSEPPTSDTKKLTNLQRVQNGIGWEGFLETGEFEYTKTEIQPSSNIFEPSKTTGSNLEQGGTILFAVQEAVDNTAHDQTQVQIQFQASGQSEGTVASQPTQTSADNQPQIKLSDGISEISGVVKNVAETTGSMMIDVGDAGKDLFRQLIGNINKAPEQKPDPKKEEKKLEAQRVQIWNQEITINTNNFEKQKVMMENALRMRVLEGTGAEAISTDEMNKLININRDFKGPLTPDKIFNLKRAIRWQQDNAKKKQSSALDSTGSKSKTGQIDHKANTNSEHHGHNAQSAVG